jgi:hypothetical protein
VSGRMNSPLAAAGCRQYYLTLANNATLQKRHGLPRAGRMEEVEQHGGNAGLHDHQADFPHDQFGFQIGDADLDFSARMVAAPESVQLLDSAPPNCNHTRMKRTQPHRYSLNWWRR